MSEATSWKITLEKSMRDFFEEEMHKVEDELKPLDKHRPKLNQIMDRLARDSTVAIKGSDIRQVLNIVRLLTRHEALQDGLNQLNWYPVATKIIDVADGNGSVEEVNQLMEKFQKGESTH